MKKIVFIVISSIVFTACAGALFQEASGKITDVSFNSNEQVFNCATNFIHDKTMEDSKLVHEGERLTIGGWSSDITKKDLSNGIMEIGDFKKENGVKVYVAQIKTDNKYITIRVKSTAPYYSNKSKFNTGVDEALNEIKNSIHNCLKKALSNDRKI